MGMIATQIDRWYAIPTYFCFRPALPCKFSTQSKNVQCLSNAAIDAPGA